MAGGGLTNLDGERRAILFCATLALFSIFVCLFV